MTACCSSATAKWGLSPKVAESGIFDNFWDTIGFAITGMVFFFSGVSSVNFFVRSAQVGLIAVERVAQHVHHCMAMPNAGCTACLQT